VVSGNADYQKGFLRPSFIQKSFFPGMSVDTLYTQLTQRETINGLLGSLLLVDVYIDPTTDRYLVRDHHSTKDDYLRVYPMVPNIEQRSTL